jgi:putative methionine-R-sulfoxide reductase with GAF domain
MLGSAQPEGQFPSAGTEGADADRPSLAGTTDNKPNGSGVLQETELDSALQLLVERAQYITGATGTALALPQGEEMVCRASAGSSAPAVGARLQVRSGLTGESISRRQLLRCDNAEADPRVNLESCRALGIASIVVLPLLRRNGEVRGLFELFSDHPYAFEERDLIALERMAALTLTALDLAEQRQASSSAPAPVATREPVRPVESAVASGPLPASVIPLHPELVEPPVVRVESPVISVPEPEPVPAAIPEAMLRVQKCATCGFPVSEGRTLCLDCEKKDTEKKDFEKKQREKEQAQIELHKIEREKIEREKREQGELEPTDVPDLEAHLAGGSDAPVPEEFVPAFLANSPPVSESWLANHVNLLAIVVLVVGILVAVVVFR